VVEHKLVDGSAAASSLFCSNRFAVSVCLNFEHFCSIVPQILHRLDHNRIRAFPNFEALGSLRSLQMQHNQIVAFEQSMTALVNLTTMDLGQAS
jgi:Leucine-rich repeat (LRR) protein